MISLFFKNSKDESREVAKCKNYKQLHKQMKKFLKAHRYKSYYTRIWEFDNKTWFDIGSHNEFFWIEGNHLEDIILKEE